MEQTSNAMSTKRHAPEHGKTLRGWVQFSLLLDLLWLPEVTLEMTAGQHEACQWLIIALTAYCLGFEALHKFLKNINSLGSGTLSKISTTHVAVGIGAIALIALALQLLEVVDRQSAFVTVGVVGITVFKVLRYFQQLKTHAKSEAAAGRVAQFTSLAPTLLPRVSALGCIALLPGIGRIALWGACATLTMTNREE